MTRVQGVELRVTVHDVGFRVRVWEGSRSRAYNLAI
jgi:hypothetical protein